MKYAKKMRLVECLEGDHNQELETNSIPPNVKDEDYSSPAVLQNMDKEMRSILNESTSDTGQKWSLYHQVLQRYLGFIKRIRNGDYTPGLNSHDGRENIPLSSEGFNSVLNGRESRRFSPIPIDRTTSTPKNTSKSIKRDLAPTGALPIRIQKRLMRQRLRNQHSRAASTLSDSATLMDDDCEEEDYEDVFTTQPSEANDADSNVAPALTRSSGVVVNGWVKSNIEK